MRVSTPFNHQVPKDIAANLKWRQAVHARVRDDPKYVSVIIDACARDPLFYLNGFGWTYAPKDDHPFPKLPFILYPFQEEGILDIIRAFRKEDLLIEKTRDMGASWMCVSAAAWCWHFVPQLSFLLGSRVEQYVDQPGNPKAMFWKFDFLIDNLPKWLQPPGYNKNEHRRKMHVENPNTLSVIDGESTTDNFARGDRRTAIILDEFAAVENGHRILAATRDATNCRIFNSTPQGTNNAFYDKRQGSIRKLRLHWSMHPIKSIGMYTTGENTELKVLDSGGYPEGYEPFLDGKLRSPWYDNECKRAGSDREIAQELDIDYGGSGSQFFNADLVNQAIRDHARPPLLVGELDYDDSTGEPIAFREDPNGHLRLWFFLDKNGKPPLEHKRSLGIDVAAGTGASNSVLSGWDNVTCEKDVEYANPRIRPEQLAKQAVALGLWLGKAFMIWESGGPGRQFGSRVEELGYGNIYLRVREEAISKKVSDIPGVAQTREVKLAIVGEYRAAIEKGEAINRSREALNEALEYVYGPDGGVMHARASSKEDPSGAKANHGDRAMADALGWKGVKERALRPAVEGPPEIPVGCLAWRNKMREQMKAKPNRQLDSSWRA